MDANPEIVTVEFLTAASELAWPVLAFIVLVTLLPTIKRIIHSRGITIKYGNMELSVQDASDQIRKQVDDIQNHISQLTGDKFSTSPKGDEPLSTESSEVEIVGNHRLILWVDDNPTNNAYEIAKLQDDGYDVSTATSTHAALNLLERGATQPDIIISDMGQREGLGYNSVAGIDFVRDIRAKGIATPTYIYCSGKAANRYRREAIETGCNGITASPTKLFQLVASGTQNIPNRPSDHSIATDGAG